MHAHHAITPRFRLNVNLLVSLFQLNDTLQVHSHHNNPTIPIVTAAWVLLTLALGFAMARRYVRFETFQYTHVAVLFFVFAAEIHAWSHWYHSLGGLALYAFDKVCLHWVRLTYSSLGICVIGRERIVFTNFNMSWGL